MAKKALLFGLSCIVFLGMSAISHGGVIVRNGVGAAETIECNGQAVEINGTSYSLTLLGECSRVDVNGMGNSVKIEMAGAINVTGMSNKVVWSEGLNGRRPSISNTGMGNSIRQGAVGTGRGAKSAKKGVTVSDDGETVGISSSSDEEGKVKTTISSGNESVDVSVEDRGGRQKVKVGGLTVENDDGNASVSTGGDAIVINDSNLDRTIRCEGDNVRINGSNNELRLRGDCGKVTVNGSHNEMKVEAAAAISVLGGYNEITWERGVGGKSPRISNLGLRNTIERGE